MKEAKHHKFDGTTQQVQYLTQCLFLIFLCNPYIQRKGGGLSESMQES